MSSSTEAKEKSPSMGPRRAHACGGLHQFHPSCLCPPRVGRGPTSLLASCSPHLPLWPSEGSPCTDCPGLRSPLLAVSSPYPLTIPFVNPSSHILLPPFPARPGARDGDGSGLLGAGQDRRPSYLWHAGAVRQAEACRGARCVPKVSTAQGGMMLCTSHCLVSHGCARAIHLSLFHLKNVPCNRSFWGAWATLSADCDHHLTLGSNLGYCSPAVLPRHRAETLIDSLTWWSLPTLPENIGLSFHSIV